MVPDEIDRAEAFAAALRAGSPPVIVRIAEARVLVDLRTVAPAEEKDLRDVLVAAATVPAPEKR